MSDSDSLEHSSIPHHHDCGNLFGCGEENGTGVIRQDLNEGIFTRRAADRLTHMDEVEPEALDRYLALRGRLRRKLLRASGFLSVLAVQPWLGRLAGAAEAKEAAASGKSAGARADGGAVHVVESNEKTVSWGVFDTTLPPILEIESGDTVVYPDTWSHFFNQLQPGVQVETLAQLRKEHPGRGPHSIIGPVAVRGAEPGDVLEIRYRSLKPFTWGAVFHNPGALGTGLLPEDFPQGQVKYLKLNLQEMTAEFLPKISVPLQPFQGTLGLAPPDGFFPPVSPGATSSVPPGPHAGNLDLRELTEGSRLFIPVWKPGALIYTGDSHAVQGDGEITLTALETRMREVRIQAVLHKQKKLAWPMAETDTDWIAMGLDRDVGAAMALAARNAIQFLVARAGLTPPDAYALCSIAVSFRVTQVVDIVRGVHALIPKKLFASGLREQITVV
ncbi:MAG TPA: acetamidase/formamidase family protein [Burkholderiaceae bacterium]